MVTQERLKEVLNYNPKTGVFTWKRGRGSVKRGSIAGSFDKRAGYIRIMIDEKIYPAHRLAWLFEHGYMPENQIDHIDGIRDNNKFKNLREATHSQNQQNRTRVQEGKKVDCPLGVCWKKETSKFVAQIKVREKVKHLGYFKTKEEASKAYIKAKRELHEYCTI